MCTINVLTWPALTCTDLYLFVLTFTGLFSPVLNWTRRTCTHPNSPILTATHPVIFICTIFTTCAYLYSPDRQFSSSISCALLTHLSWPDLYSSALPGTYPFLTTCTYPFLTELTSTHLPVLISTVLTCTSQNIHLHLPQLTYFHLHICVNIHLFAAIICTVLTSTCKQLPQFTCTHFSLVFMCTVLSCTCLYSSVLLLLALAYTHLNSLTIF